MQLVVKVKCSLNCKIIPLQPLPWLSKSIVKRMNKCSSSGSGSGSGSGSDSGSQ